MTTVARALPVRSAGLLGAALVAAGLITAGVASAGPPCSYTIDNLEQARSAITAAAPGVRFFGNGHRILSNVIQNLPAIGASHPDCFETFDTGHPATFDIEIVGNACQHVAENCLVATGDERGNGDAPLGARSITFIGNTCATEGDQGVYLRRWAEVDLRKNTFSGRNLKRGILISAGSTGCTAADNTIPGNVPAVQIDDSSRPGFNSPF